MVSVSKGRSISGWISLSSFSMILVFSSDSLMILGNTTGMAGKPFLFIISVIFLIYSATLFSCVEIFGDLTDPGAEPKKMDASMYRILLVMLLLLPRFLFAVCAGTGLAATAGYAFNEIFVYWFPNMGFSFFLLIVVLLVGLSGNRITCILQITSICIASLGLLFLTSVGLFMGEGSETAAQPMEAASFNPLHVCALGMVLLLGFDLALFSPASDGMQSIKVFRPMLAAIIVSSVILGLWSFVSNRFVTPERLINSSVPYAIVARTILGETGRKIMGLIIIFSACGALNGLFACVSRVISSMGAHGFLPSFFDFPKGRPVVSLSFLVLSVAAMLAFGMAGYPILMVMAKSGIFLWFISYALIHLSVLLKKRRRGFSPGILQRPWDVAVPVFGLCTTCSGAFLLLWFESDSLLMIRIVLTALTVSLLFSIVWIRWDVKHREC